MSSDFINRFKKAKSNVQAPSYKRMFISPTQGREYRLRFLDPKVIDGEGLPFAYVYLHGNYMHPNFDQQFPSNFRCGGKGCPLCADARAISQKEKENNVPSKEKQGFKKQARKYAIYWAINEENNELTLVHVPDHSNNRDEETLSQMLSNKIQEFYAMGLEPFSEKEGMDIVFSTTLVDTKIKFTIDIDSASKKEVPPMVTKKLEQMKALNQVYKRYSHEELAHIADGTKIPYGAKAKEEKASSDAKQDFQKEEKSISEESFDFPASSDGNELDDLVYGNVNTDDLQVDTPSGNNLSEKLKRLSNFRGSEDN